ncbi:MAG TPA: hypothetical protein VHD38_03035 [Candidatus Paceibacterota bacterium]|nr:hypothetical protein [Candidatus Paceibacterota bacterium]
MSRERAYAILAALLILLLALAYFLFHGLSLTTLPALGGSHTKAGQDAPPPPPSEQVVAQLQASKGFTALVSYTDKGFEPSHITVKKGETIRFVNNAPDALLWVGSTGTPYPGKSACGASRLDTCKALKSGEFWEFTFDAAGSWNYQNNTKTADGGVIVVE